MARHTVQPSRWRILYSSDCSNIFWSSQDPWVEPKHLEAVIDQLADTGVDAFASCVVDRWQAFYRSAVTERPALNGKGTSSVQHWYVARALDRLISQGTDPLDIMARRARKHGIAFIATARMNDMHRLSIDNALYGKFRREHMDWRLGEFEGAGLDYRHARVRQFTLEIFEELLRENDIDGLEMDFIRHPWFFKPGREEEGKGLMTELVRQVKDQVEKWSRRHGRPLVLGVRVPSTLELAAARGLEVERWIAEGLVDYVSPSDFFFTDLRMPVRSFRQATADSGVALLPTLHPFEAADSACSPFRSATILTPTRLKTAANLFYQQGADGMAVYNWHVPPLKQVTAQIDLETLRLIGDRDSVAKPPHHYLLPALWGDQPTMIQQQVQLAVDAQTRGDVVDLETEDLPEQTLAFELCKCLQYHRGSGYLRLKLENATPEHRIRLTLNGSTLPLERASRQYFHVGRHAHRGSTLNPYQQLTFPLEGLNLRMGVNRIGGTLLETPPGLSAAVRLREPEVRVDAAPPSDGSGGTLPKSP